MLFSGILPKTLVRLAASNITPRISSPVKDNLVMFATVVKSVNLGFTVNDDGTYQGPGADRIPSPECVLGAELEEDWDPAFDDTDDDGLLDDHSSEGDTRRKRPITRHGRSGLFTPKP